MKIACVGSGLTGSVIARILADQGLQVDVFEKRNHVAGNCYTETDFPTGITVHKYGAHIFKTNNEQVWQFVNRFSDFEPYRHRVIANTDRGIFTLPINLATLNQFFNRNMSPSEAKAFIKNLTRPPIDGKDFESTAIKLVGAELYENFFKHYTMKQWGRSPKELSGAVFKRLPIRFNYDDSYHRATYSAIPSRGYTEMVYNILDHKNIKLIFEKASQKHIKRDYRHVFYTGQIDEYFNYRFGRLDYRSLVFDTQTIDLDDYQGTSVINNCTSSKHIKHTRTIEHKHFLRADRIKEKTIVTTEYSQEYDLTNEPYYPINDLRNQKIYHKYLDYAQKTTPGITFCGRLGSYKYFDMDDAIGQAITLGNAFL